MKINMHTSHPSAFISSTFVDLREDRSVVAQALRGRGLNVNALDIRPASNQSSKNEILNGIKESDFVILIVGDRFGSILKAMTGSESRSITWWEYENAHKLGKPIIPYFKNVDSTDSINHDEADQPNYKKKRALFGHFKEIITKTHNPSYYDDPYDLSGQIDESLIKIYRDGVKDLSQKNSISINKISQLENEVSILSSRLSTLAPSNPTNRLLELGTLGSNVSESQTGDTLVNALLKSINDKKT